MPPKEVKIVWSDLVDRKRVTTRNLKSEIFKKINYLLQLEMP